jgi:glucose/arabinose dehydrogenase
MCIRLAIVALSALLAGCGGGSGSRKADATARNGKKTPSPNSTPSPAGGAGGVKLVKVASGLKEPTSVVGAPGDPGTIMVTERAGRVWAFRDGERQPDPFLDISDQVSVRGGEQGLQSIAFAPDYGRSGRFYAYFTDKGDDIRILEVRGGAQRTVLKIHHPTEPPKGTPKTAEDLRVHNGGQLAFGPDDLLYIGTGDAGGQKDPGNRGQDTTLLLGKLLRIDPRPQGRRAYRIPRGNPFAGGRRARPEIFAFGLRNPNRFSFDRATGDLYLADVGQNQIEEINFLPRGEGAGSNFGWSCLEGRERFKPCQVKDPVYPIIERPSSGSAGRCAAITGGYVVRDETLPALNGRYLYSDFCESRLRVAKVQSGTVSEDEEQGITVPWPSTFGEDDDGRIYVASYFLGDVYRLAAG